MAYTAIRGDTGNGCYGGNSLPHSETTPLLYSPEHEHGNAPPPPQSVPGVSVLRCIHCLERDDPLFEAALPVHGSSYAPQWNTPTMHSSVQDQRYGVPVPYVNDMARSYNVWTDPRQSAPFAPATAMVSITLS
jgi:hypothetical protein